MIEGLRIVLLLFAAVGFGGAGAALAGARYRQLTDGELAAGMVGVTAMLAMFGLLCVVVGSGWIGALAFGGVVMWASYVFMAQQMGLFRVETPARPSPEEEESTEESRRAH
jgi:hypothetical protein